MGFPGFFGCIESKAYEFNGTLDAFTSVGSYHVDSIETKSAEVFEY